MKTIDENYFVYKDHNNKYNKIEEILDEDEQLLWKGKPKKKAFILNAFFKMMPFAIVWLCFDLFFISNVIGAAEIFDGLYIFLIVFFAFHLMPVWIWIYNVITANKKHKNLDYAFTNKRIIVKSGIIGIDFKTIYYSEIDLVNLKVGLIDKMLHVGDIYIKSSTGATILYDLENPYFISQKLQKIVVDIKTDIEFPNNLRPKENNGYNTKYRP